jgi:hypothetical protein
MNNKVREATREAEETRRSSNEFEDSKNGMIVEVTKELIEESKNGDELKDSLRWL